MSAKPLLDPERLPNRPLTAAEAKYLEDHSFMTCDCGARLAVRCVVGAKTQCECGFSYEHVESYS